MNCLRRHLLAIAVATMSVHAATLTAGALRTCWGTQHRHGGSAAPDCAMHHGSGAVDAHTLGHGHAHHPGDGAQVACKCDNNAGALFVAPDAIVGTTSALAIPAEAHTLTRVLVERLSALAFPPLSPPPRSTSF